MTRLIKIDLNIYVFDVGGDLCGSFNHRRNGTIFFFGQANRILDRLARYFTTDPVGQLDLGVNRGVAGGALAVGADFEAGEGFALLAQNADDIRRSASAE